MRMLTGCLLNGRAPPMPQDPGAAAWPLNNPRPPKVG
jgi:hypothetical protein